LQHHRYDDDDDFNDDNCGHHISAPTTYSGAAIEKMSLDQENAILKKLSVSSLSILRSSPPQRPRKDDNRQKQQVDYSYIRSSYYDDDDDCDDDGYTESDLSQHPSPTVECWARRNLGSATTTSNTDMDYGR
jgi:hypothetical protein